VGVAALTRNVFQSEFIFWVLHWEFGWKVGYSELKYNLPCAIVSATTVGLKNVLRQTIARSIDRYT